MYDQLQWPALLTGNCACTGEPHFTGYDGSLFDFQGDMSDPALSHLDYLDVPIANVTHTIHMQSAVMHEQMWILLLLTEESTNS